MAAEQHLTWTVLPDGLSDDGTQARVSVFIAPRLDTPGQADETTLEHFPDFLTWPDKVKAATFDFATGDGTPAASSSVAGPLTLQGPGPDTHLWTGLFDAHTPVQPFVFDNPAQREYRTYSAKDVRTATRNAYVGTATSSPETPPPTGDVLGPLGTAPADADDVTAAAGGAIGPDAGLRQALTDLRTFHSTLSKPTLHGGKQVQPPRPSLPRVDFHQMLTSLGDHPALLRRLGLVLDFLLPADRLPVSSGERFLTVTPHWTSALGPHSHDVPLRTRYVFLLDFLPGRHVFVPGARSRTAADPLAPPSRGVEALPEATFSVEQADIDGAALKLLSLPPDARGLSTVRTHGISLVKDKRLDGLKAEFGQAAEHHTALNRVLALDGATVPEPESAPSGAAPSGAQPPDAPELFAEDLIRGHRLDIWDEQLGHWFSLHEREVEYRQPQGGPLLLTASDEGFFQVNLVSPPPEINDRHLAVPEQLVTWEGWSLSAHRPGLVLDTDEGSVEDDRPPNAPVAISNDAKTALPLEITTTARPGSLPRLRFGHGYRMRLRTVDLAGNGPGLPEADDLMKGDGLALPGAGLLTFRRFEAVPAPAVAPRLPFGEGASAFRLVIRSSPGAGPPAAAPPGPGGTPVRVVLARVQFGETNDDVRTVQQALIDRGHALPGGADGVFGDRTRAAYAQEQRDQGFTGSDADGIPGCTSLTELGRKSGFTVDCGNDTTDTTDAAAGVGAGRTAEQYAADFNRSSLVTKDGHVPYQGVDERHLVAPKASLRCVEWHGRLDAAIGSTDHGVQNTLYDLAVRESGSLNDPSQPNVHLEPVDSPAADPKNPAITALHSGEEVELPYLPDPLATGAVFLDLPGMPPGEPFPIPWGGEVWHRPRSFRLRLAEGTGPPRFDEATRVLTVLLPKGAVATVRVSSRIDFDEHVMGVAAWCREPADPAAPGTAGTAADEAGRTADRQRTDEAMALAAAGRHWMFTPPRKLTLVHAVQQPLRRPVLELSTDAPRRAAGATAEHLAGTVALDEGTTGRIDLVAEWTEVTDGGPTGRDTRPMTVPVFGLLTARAAVDGVPGTEPAVLRDGVLTFSTKAAEDRAKTIQADPHSLDKSPPAPQKHEFGDTKHRTVRYHPVAASAFGDCFPPQFAEPGEHALTVEGDPAEHSVPSSAPPTAPRLLYCMPTLAFEPVDGPPDTLVHRRRGGGIRVYLDRPWFSSGDGELLGVVLGEPPGGDPTSVRDSWVTLMGRDPIHRSAPVVAPTAATFPHAERQSGNLTIPTLSGPLPVTVVGFTPQFEADAKGGRWFCDLDLDTGDACLPFVRLALVRFQPEAIPGAEISQVVLADLVRTLPDRELRVTLGDALTVSVTGPSWDPTGSQPPRITTTLQRRNRAVDDEDLGWVTLDDTATVLTSIDAESSRTPFYTGQVPIPPERRGAPLRLLVMETEGIPADGSTAPTPPTPPATPTTPGPVIYCDTVDLPRGLGGPDDGHDGHDGHGDDGDDGHDGPGDHGDHGGPPFHGGPGPHGGPGFHGGGHP